MAACLNVDNARDLRIEGDLVACKRFGQYGVNTEYSRAWLLLHFTRLPDERPRPKS